MKLPLSQRPDPVAVGENGFPPNPRAERHRRTCHPARSQLSGAKPMSAVFAICEAHAVVFGVIVPPLAEPKALEPMFQLMLRPRKKLLR